MRKITYLVILSVLFFAACSTTQKVTQPLVSGDDYMAQGEYGKALYYFENKINEVEAAGKDANTELIRKAGIAAYKLENINKATAYFERAIYLKSDSEEMMEMMIAAYHSIDNLSKEITAIEKYLEKYPEGTQVKNVQTRLFETCLESENWEQANQLWEGFGPEAINDARLLDIYLKLNLAQKNEEKSDELAAKLLKLDANNLTALERMGAKYFWKAENRYQKETKAYDKKRTRSQYAKLLKALDIVTADFKKSLGYFKKLYQLNPDKTYAKYLGNIYARLDDKERSVYYKNRAR